MSNVLTETERKNLDRILSEAGPGRGEEDFCSWRRTGRIFSTEDSPELSIIIATIV